MTSSKNKHLTGGDVRCRVKRPGMGEIRQVYDALGNFMAEHSMSASEIAKLSHLSPSTISQFRRGIYTGDVKRIAYIITGLIGLGPHTTKQQRRKYHIYYLAESGRRLTGFQDELRRLRKKTTRDKDIIKRITYLEVESEGEISRMEDILNEIRTR